MLLVFTLHLQMARVFWVLTVFTGFNFVLICFFFFFFFRVETAFA